MLFTGLAILLNKLSFLLIISYYNLNFYNCQILIAAILETVGFEPTPQFLQNRFKEKIADRSAAYTDLF